MGSFEYFEHTADVGIRVFAEDAKDLFYQGALAVVGVMVERRPGTKSAGGVMREFRLPQAALEEQFLRWLRELLYYFQVEKFVFTGIRKFAQSSGSLIILAQGERFDPRFYQPGHEIKAVTYHRYQLISKGQGYESAFILDL
ncbi:MAG: archease [Candidatus Omnitrophota bacterium]